MPETLYKLGVLAFTAILTIVFREPLCLLLLFLLSFSGAKKQKQFGIDLHGEFDNLHKRLDDIAIQGKIDREP